MQYALFGEIPWMPENVWIVPIIGGVVCAVAFLFGRRFLVAHSDKALDLQGPFDASFLRGITRDRRSSPRRRGNTVEVQLLTGKDDRPLAGWVLDRSQGGLCLLVDQPFDQGVTVRVRPRKASTTTPWTEIIVRSCRAEAGQYELGCQFHHPPNWSLLLMFG